MQGMNQCAKKSAKNRAKNGIRIVSVLLLGLMVSQGFAAEEKNRDVEKISIIVQTKEIKKNKEIIDLESVLKKKNFPLKHPDKVINPTLTESKYSGVSVADLLADAQINAEQQKKLAKETVTFVGRDGYSVALPLADALQSQATLVGYENDARLNWRKGAPFLAFLKIDEAKYLQEPSWWGWWISAILIGSPVPTLSVNGKSLDVKNIFKNCSEKSEGELNYPRGRRRSEPPRANRGELTSCSLSVFLKNIKTPEKNLAKPYKVEFMTGQQQTVTDLSQFRLVTKFKGQNIPAELGGPFQLCDTKGKQECRYFLTSLQEEK